MSRLPEWRQRLFLWHPRQPIGCEQYSSFSLVRQDIEQFGGVLTCHAHRAHPNRLRAIACRETMADLSAARKVVNQPARSAAIPGDRLVAMGVRNFKTKMIASKPCATQRIGMLRPVPWAEQHEKVRFMERSESLKSISVEELWSLHERVISTLVRRMAQEKAKLEERLRRLQSPDDADGSNSGKASRNRTCRPYPKVLPKYQNPKNP